MFFNNPRPAPRIISNVTTLQHTGFRADVTRLFCSGFLDYLPKSLLPRKHSERHSSSSRRWQTRQGRDQFTIEARVKGLKGRAAFKLLEIDEKYRIFRSSQTVVDLGYAPGSWSQVAVDRTSPNGRVLGIDVIPVQPPKGVSTIQGNFLSPAVQLEVKKLLRESGRGRTRTSPSLNAENGEVQMTEDDLRKSSRSSFELEEWGNADRDKNEDSSIHPLGLEWCNDDEREGRVVDIILSDMMMNTSGVKFKDHAGSMDLCDAALRFAFDTLRTDGHFVCKFYQGSEENAFELRLRNLFAKVHREKPDASRNESKEAYFVALRRKKSTKRRDVISDDA